MNSTTFTRAKLLVLVALTTPLPLACRKHDPEKAKPAYASPAELKQGADAARASLAGLKPLLETQNARFAALHHEFDPLPPGLPEFGETRGTFYAADEGLGMLNTKQTWLSSRIDAAVTAGDLAGLQQVSQDIAKTYADVRAVERLGLELAERVRPFQQEATIKLEQMQALGKSTCE